MSNQLALPGLDALTVARDELRRVRAAWLAPREQDDAKTGDERCMSLPTALGGIVESISRGGHDPMLPVGTARCQCSGCDRYFSSVGSFDKHRRDGRCLTPDEMRERGMLVNARGYWVSSEFTRDVS